jgi:hypothetical protein
MRRSVRRKLSLYRRLTEHVYRTGYRCVSVCEKNVSYIYVSLYIATGQIIGASVYKTNGADIDASMYMSTDQEMDACLCTK